MFARLSGYATEDGSIQPPAQARPPEEATRPASLHEFADWLLAAGESDRICCAHLRALYAEFAMFSETPSLSDSRFFRGLKGAGIVRKREGTGARKWYYAVRRRQASSNIAASKCCEVSKSRTLLHRQAA